MSTIDVNEARIRLVQELGDSAKSYFAHLKEWFCMKTSKDEFNLQVRHFLPQDKLHLHNDFVFAVITKCQSLCEPNHYALAGNTGRQHPQQGAKMNVRDREEKPFAAAQHQTRPNSMEIKPHTITKTIKPKNKPLKVNFENRFQPVDPISLLPPLPPRITLDKAHQVRYCSRDLTLPDNGLVHGRMLVAAWDAGLERGCEDKAIKLVLAATERFLKELVIAVVANRKGYRLREGKVVHSVGRPSLNPWLHNSWTVIDSTSNSYATEICLSAHPPHVPSLPSTAQKAERDSAFYLACTAEQDTPLKPISVLDVLQTLQIKKSIIPSHSVYAVNMERISQRLYHPD